MRFRTTFLLAILLVANICVARTAAGPSPTLASDLDKPCTAVSLKQCAPESAVRQTLAHAQLKHRIQIEQSDVFVMKERDFVISSGTLRSQLDQIAKAAGFTYECNGDWINLYPKEVASDPTYIMNRRIPGKIIVGGAAPTDLRQWLSNNHVSFARVFCGLRRTKVDVKKALYTSITLDNPTLRQYVNAHEELFGSDTSSLFIHHIPDAHDPKSMLFVIDQWSDNSGTISAPDADSAPALPDWVKKQDAPSR